MQLTHEQKCRVYQTRIANGPRHRDDWVAGDRFCMPEHDNLNVYVLVSLMGGGARLTVLGQPDKVWDATFDSDRWLWVDTTAMSPEPTVTPMDDIEFEFPSTPDGSECEPRLAEHAAIRVDDRILIVSKLRLSLLVNDLRRKLPRLEL